MIVPFLDGLLTFSRAPITWLLIFMNVFLWSQNRALSEHCQEELKTFYENEDFIFTQGQIYKQFHSRRQIAQVDDISVLGHMAFRDEAFLQMAPSLDWRGDPIAIRAWKSSISDFKQLRSYYPPFIFGVTSSQHDWFSYMTYQFFHEGFFHLFGNILLVLIIGGFLERRHSGLMVFTVYLTGGVLSAYFYSLTSGLSGAPLVGASGSLCALFGFLAVAHWGEKTRLFYFLLPSKRHMGFVEVTTIYWVLWLCMLEDLSGWLSQPEVFASGVAHLVHIFGFFVGAVIAFALQRLPKVQFKSL